MQLYNYKGKRIRASDKSLVFRFYACTLLSVFTVVLLLLNSGQLTRTDWGAINLRSGITFTPIPYHVFTVIIASIVCGLLAFLYYRFCFDYRKQIQHRQKLARMKLDKRCHEFQSVQGNSFFTDLPSSKTKEKITYFPKLYYRMEKGLLHIQCEITLGKYQDQLLNLEKKLESGLYCELTDKILHDSYVQYTFLYDTIANRISIEDVQAKDGKLQLMENVFWEYDSLPHMLIAGGTGGGKTYYILTIIEALLHTNAKLYILDQKNADLVDLQTVMPDVYYRKEDMTSCIDKFYDDIDMMARSEAMKLMHNYKTGENYAYLGLAPCFLIFDEYVAFMEMLGNKENTAVLNKLKQIVMLGLQAGFFLILACQRPDAKYLGDGIRDQFCFRRLLWKRVGTSVISKFYTPLVPKGHDFLQTIGKLAQSRQDGQVACGAKATPTALTPRI